MLGKIAVGMMTVAVLFAAVNGRGAELTAAVGEGVSGAVSLVLKLGGLLCFWSGILKVLEKAGVAKALADRLSPLLGRLFPQVPKGSRAMQAVAMNVCANMLGLSNAATPLGLTAMGELVRLPRTEAGRASPAMVRFVVLNTASVQLIPTGVAAIRMAAGAQSPFDILPAVLFCSLSSLAAALLVTTLGKGAGR